MIHKVCLQYQYFLPRNFWGYTEVVISPRQLVCFKFKPPPPFCQTCCKSSCINCIFCHPKNTSTHVRSIHRMCNRNILAKDQLKIVRALGHCMHLLRFHLFLNLSTRLLFLFTLNFILVSSLTVIRRVST